MTTIRQLIIDGYREGGLIGSGETPDVEQFDEGLRKLQTLVRSFFGNEIGYKLQTISFGINGDLNSYGKYQDVASTIQTVGIPSGVRLVCNLAETKTLYLDPNPQDGARFAIIDNSDNFATRNLVLKGNGRSIEGSATATLSTSGLNREWFYRADLGSWERIQDFTANSESPLPFEFDELLTTLLALRLSSRFGAPISGEINTYMTRMVKMFKSRYQQIIEMPLDAALTRLTADYFANRYSDDPNAFNYGAIGWLR